MLLIITGCIEVNGGVPYVTINETNERLEAYNETIRWAIMDTAFDKIVFCENSNYSLDKRYINELLKTTKKEFEYLTFKGNVLEVIKHGKGYGEGEIISYALNNSVLLQGQEYFYKLTGRLTISNVSSLVRNNGKNLFMVKKTINEVDTRFYGIKKKDFTDYLLNSYKKVFDESEYFLERVYYDDLKNNKIKYRSFYKRPLFNGVSGSTGRIYADKRKKNEFINDYLYFTNVANSKLFLCMREFILKRKRECIIEKKPKS